MNNYTSIRNQSCPNKRCRFCDKTLEGNVIVHSQTARRMKRKACGKTWAAYRHEACYGLRSDPQKIEAAITMFKAGISIRRIARRIHASPSTIQRWKAHMEENSII